MDYEGPSDNTYSLETLSRKCKIGHITYAIPRNDIVFPHFSSLFDIFTNFHEYANEIFFI